VSPIGARRASFEEKAMNAARGAALAVAIGALVTVGGAPAGGLLGNQLGKARQRR
jgi:hypothetical protein